MGRERAVDVISGIPEVAGKRGNAMALYAVVLLAAAVVVFLRYGNLGDLSVTRKIAESLLWGLAVLFLGAVFVRCIGVAFATGSYVAMSDSTESKREGSASVRPEELADYEAEMSEVAAPELDGIKGKPPEELANALRNLSNKDET